MASSLACKPDFVYIFGLGWHLGFVWMPFVCSLIKAHRFSY